MKRSLLPILPLLRRGRTVFRTPKSHIVNLNYVAKYLRGEGGQVVLTDGTAVDVSRQAKPDLIKNLLGEG
ncbi:MAG: LytTR family transcriptional regulator [Cytophagaceae bacterium]|nr:LytTR family transcriptional regulator [Cytophagaceae bacterium]